MSQVIKNLLNNNRFYTLVFAFLASIFVLCFLRLQDISDQLYYIQLEQAFGFIALSLLYVTLIISPIQKIIGTPEWMKNVVFARRGLGVSAAYFALLHAGTSLWGQLGGIDGLMVLPNKFVWALTYSFSALLILCILTFTSFDKVIIRMGYHRWKQLQRFVYLCGLLIILHVWMIGVHFASGIIRDIYLVAIIILFGLESWRLIDFLAERWRWHKTTRYFLSLALWAIGVLVLGLISFSRPVEAHMLLKDTQSEQGTVLHITPDDDPIAGQQSALLYDIQGISPSHEHLTAILLVVDDQNHETSVMAHVRENTVAADFTFPKQGLYTLILNIQQDNKQIRQFTESQRVSRGTINSTAMRSIPPWAGVGLLCTALAAIAVAGIAFSRRKAIKIYSKL